VLQYASIMERSRESMYSQAKRILDSRWREFGGKDGLNVTEADLRELLEAGRRVTELRGDERELEMLRQAQDFKTLEGTLAVVSWMGKQEASEIVTVVTHSIVNNPIAFFVNRIGRVFGVPPDIDQRELDRRINARQAAYKILKPTRL